MGLRLASLREHYLYQVQRVFLSQKALFCLPYNTPSECAYYERLMDFNPVRNTPAYLQFACHQTITLFQALA